MKPIRTLGVPLLLVLLLLAGCSLDKLTERGAGILDDMFAGEQIKSTAPNDPEPAPDAEPAGTQAEEPEISGLTKPVVSDYPGNQPSEEPAQSDPEPSKPVQSEPAQPAAAPPSGVTPSHTDVTFFSAGESFRYLPKGVSGVYACTYTAGDEKVASIDPDTGKVTAVGPGTTKVKMHVEYNGQYDFECVVRCGWKDDKKAGAASGSDPEPVLPPQSGASGKPAAPDASATDGVTASHSDATFFNPKEHFRLQPVGAGDDYTVSYSTSDAGVAQVDEKTGTVTAVGPGTATVTMFVDCGGSEYTFQCIVRCNW